ncbi:MAG TPA: TadE family protein [Candidatus Limnocylindria bacterium]|nr:TadE family protein [Candidatus Limnocylindria bacterium]
MRFHKEDSAQSLVEFALVLPIILLVVTGVFDVARAAWQENTLAFAAREGSRYAIVHGSGATLALGPSDPSEAHIANIVTANAIGVYSITVTTAWPDGGNDRGMRVSVDATAPFIPLPSQYLLGNAFQITLKGGSMLVIQQ